MNKENEYVERADETSCSEPADVPTQVPSPLQAPLAPKAPHTDQVAAEFLSDEYKIQLRSIALGVSQSADFRDRIEVPHVHPSEMDDATLLDSIAQMSSKDPFSKKTATTRKYEDQKYGILLDFVTIVSGNDKMRPLCEIVNPTVCFPLFALTLQSQAPGLKLFQVLYCRRDEQAFRTLNAVLNYFAQNLVKKGYWGVSLNEGSEDWANAQGEPSTVAKKLKMLFKVFKDNSVLFEQTHFNKPGTYRVYFKELWAGISRLRPDFGRRAQRAAVVENDYGSIVEAYNKGTLKLFDFSSKDGYKHHMAALVWCLSKDLTTRSGLDLPMYTLKQFVPCNVKAKESKFYGCKAYQVVQFNAFKTNTLSLSNIAIQDCDKMIVDYPDASVSTYKLLDSYLQQLPPGYEGELLLHRASDKAIKARPGRLRGYFAGFDKGKYDAPIGRIGKNYPNECVKFLSAICGFQKLNGRGNITGRSGRKTGATQMADGCVPQREYSFL